MSEAIFSHTIEERSRIGEPDSSQIPTDTKWTVWKGEHKVSVALSRLYTGRPVNRYGRVEDKRYYTWHTDRAFGFVRTSTGLARPFQCRKSGIGRKHPWTPQVPIEAVHPFSDALAETPYADAYKQAMWDVFKIKRFSDIFPMSEHFPMKDYASIPPLLRRAFREEDGEAFTTRLFGKTRNTAALRRAVEDSDPYFISLAHQMRGACDDAKLTEFLRVNHTVSDEIKEQTTYPPYMRRTFKALTRDAANSLAGIEIDLSDARRIYSISIVAPERAEKRIGDNKEPVRNWTELADVFKTGNW